MNSEEITGTARNAVRSFFERFEQRILKPKELAQLVAAHGDNWEIPSSTPFKTVLGVLAEEVGLRIVRLDFPSRPETRYVLGKVSVYDIALSLRPNCYLTHHTSLYLNALTESEPDEIYVNSEQTDKPRWDSTLTQENIDRAFQRPFRTTNNKAEYEDRVMYFLSGKYTGGVGVVTKTGPYGNQLRTTTLERCLIDATVRPGYSGGIAHVLKAYHSAKGQASIPVLAETLSQLDLMYPYHQAIGFLLEKSGAVAESEIELFRRLPMQFDFYLCHQMKSPRYSKSWRIYYPAILDGQ